MENPIKMDDLVVPLFLETPINEYILQMFKGVEPFRRGSVPRWNSDDFTLVDMSLTTGTIGAIGHHDAKSSYSRL